MQHRKRSASSETGATCLRVDLNWRAVGQADQWLKRRVPDVKKRIDATRSAHDFDRMRAIDFGDGVDRLVEVRVRTARPSRSGSAGIPYDSQISLQEQTFFASDGQFCAKRYRFERLS